MNTLLLTAGDCAKAAGILRAGGLVALPTETVYGLGANALDESAVRRVYAVKGRPADNPLILHVSGPADIALWCRNVPAAAYRLAARFWPGPLTLLLEKNSRVPSFVTAGLPAVALRCPDHPLALEVLRLAAVPVAAPSANLSGRPSTTTAAHCVQDLWGRVEAILDGGPCAVGLESTILDMTVSPPRVLRPGGVTLERLREVLGPVELDAGLVSAGQTPKAPGMKYRHYAPRAELLLLRGGRRERERYVNRLPDEGTAVLCFAGEEEAYPGKRVLAYGREYEPETLAAAVFAGLRALDTPETARICAMCPGEEGVGLAVVNRLQKAAGGRIVWL